VFTDIRRLYSNENIEKLQTECIEMDLVKQVVHKVNDSQHSVIGKVHAEALEQPNYKAFKGNANYGKAMDASMKCIVEFDTDFNNEQVYEEERKSFDTEKFKQERAKEEKEERETEKLFGSQRRAVKVASPKKKRRAKAKSPRKKVQKKKPIANRKRKRQEIEVVSDDDSDDSDDEYRAKVRKRPKRKLPARLSRKPRN